MQQGNETEVTEKQNKNLGSPGKVFLATVVSILILYYYLHDQDWKMLVEATQEANLWLAFGAAFALVLNIWVFEVYLRGLHYTWFHGPFPWRDYFWMRGALFLVLVINGPLSAAARALYVVKKTESSWMLYFGISFFRIFLRAGALAMVMLPLTWFVFELSVFKDSSMNRFYWWVFVGWNLFVLVDLYIAFFHKRYFGVTRLLFNKLDHEFFRPFQMATHFQWFWTMLVGLVPFLVFISSYWVMAYAFNIVIPIFYFAVCFVFVLILSNLPISFGGFGTTTMAWMLFFGAYGEESAMLSFTLFLPLSLLCIQGLIGVLCLKPALGDLGSLLQEARQKNQSKDDQRQAIRKMFFD